MGNRRIICFSHYLKRTLFQNLKLMRGKESKDKLFHPAQLSTIFRRWLSKFADPCGPSFASFLYIFFYICYWTCSHPEYSFNTACCTLSNNQSMLITVVKRYFNSKSDWLRGSRDPCPPTILIGRFLRGIHLSIKLLISRISDIPTTDWSVVTRCTQLTRQLRMSYTCQSNLSLLG